MSESPYRLGYRWRGFIVVKPDRGWGGAYGQTHRPAEWACESCGYKVRGTYSGSMQRMAEHEKQGHAPCAFCGTPLLRRKDGSPRQHRANVCSGKTLGHLIEREFVKNMTKREFR